jgi:ubiquinone/menaquinone biosynthesis C-methylase UbiE
MTETNAVSSAASFERYSANAAENYDRYFVPAIGLPLAEQLVERAALQPGERVIDLACGTGVVAKLAADRVGAEGAVVGVDMNLGMLAVAQSTSATGLVSWREAKAESLPLDDAGCDVVLCQMGLQFFTDKQTALREAHRVLDRSGRMLANLPGPTPALFEVLEDALGRHLSPDVARFVAAVFSLHDESALSGLFTTAGFGAVDVTSETPALQLPRPGDFLWQYIHSTPLSAAVANLDEDQRRALEADVVAGWAPHATEGGLRLDLRVTTVVARR